ncbi:unnamed protein product [Lampetra fluviatilis]
MHVARAQATDDTHGDTRDNTRGDTRDDTHGDTRDDTHDNTRDVTHDNTHGDTCGDTHSDTHGVTHDNTRGDTCSDTHSDTHGVTHDNTRGDNMHGDKRDDTHGDTHSQAPDTTTTAAAIRHAKWPRKLANGDVFTAALPVPGRVRPGARHVTRRRLAAGSRRGREGGHGHETRWSTDCDDRRMHRLRSLPRHLCRLCPQQHKDKDPRPTGSLRQTDGASAV